MFALDQTFDVSQIELQSLNTLQPHLEAPPLNAPSEEPLAADFLEDSDRDLPSHELFTSGTNSSSMISSMPPPPSMRQIVKDDSEEVDLPYSIYELDDFAFALAL